MSRLVRLALVLALMVAALVLSGLTVLADQQGPGVGAPPAQVGHNA